MARILKTKNPKEVKKRKKENIEIGKRNEESNKTIVLNWNIPVSILKAHEFNVPVKKNHQTGFNKNQQKLFALQKPLPKYKVIEKLEVKEYKTQNLWAQMKIIYILILK